MRPIDNFTLDLINVRWIGQHALYVEADKSGDPRIKSADALTLLTMTLPIDMNESFAAFNEMKPPACTSQLRIETTENDFAPIRPMDTNTGLKEDPSLKKDSVPALLISSFRRTV